MSGHSKWATIKHKKGAADAARGKLFAKLIRQVEVAAREGGGDPDMNPTLRTMYQKARDASVPLDTIERAIKRGTGDLEGVIYEQITYEGYAPGGVAVLIEVLTDNRNRTGCRGAQHLHQVRRVDGRAGRGGLAVRAQGLRPRRPRRRGGRPHAARARRRRRGPRRRRRGVAHHHPAHRAPRRAHRARGGRGDGRLVRAHDAPHRHHRARHRRGGQEGAAPDRRARGQRRRAGRLRQLRHPRRASSRRSTPDGRRGGPTRARLHAGRQRQHRRRAARLLARRVPRPGRWCSSSTRATTRRSARASSTATPRTSTRSPRRARRCWRSARSRWQSHDDFSCKQGGFAFPLLADTDKAVGEAYGILGPLGFYRRSVFVVDAEGVVRYAHRAVAGLTFRSTDELVARRERRASVAPGRSTTARRRRRGGGRGSRRARRARARWPASTQAMPPMYQARLVPP